MTEEQKSEMPPVRYMMLFAGTVGIVLLLAGGAWATWGVLHIFFKDVKYWHVLVYCNFVMLVLNWHEWHKDRYSSGSPWLMIFIFYVFGWAGFWAVYYLYHAL